MVVDAQGRAYVGNFGYERFKGEDARPAVMARVDPDGRVSVAATDMLFPNGAVITPDGKRLIVGETMGNRLTALLASSRPDERPRSVQVYSADPDDARELTSYVRATARAIRVVAGPCHRERARSSASTFTPPRRGSTFSDAGSRRARTSFATTSNPTSATGSSRWSPRTASDT